MSQLKQDIKWSVLVPLVRNIEAKRQKEYGTGKIGDESSFYEKAAQDILDILGVEDEEDVLAG